MSGKDYRRKRDLAKSGEPDFESSAHADTRAIFVVQLHHASRRHFDFRLQVGDALKSWAVPKGPSFDPSVKRLAVEVEDHPVGYAGFEGDIEEGYGKGHVDLFDRGVWATGDDARKQLEKGHLAFELFGERLKGGWHLVRSHRKERQPAWFLIKGKDRYAGKREADDLLDAKMIESTRRAARSPKERAAARRIARKKTARKTAPTRRSRSVAPKRNPSRLTGARKTAADAGFFKPELARLREAPPEGNEWLHEVKWDGYRVLTGIADGDIRLWSRNALPWNARVPEIVDAIAELKLTSARLDGELIALDNGLSDFNLLQKTLSGEASAPLVYMLFDVPYLDGYDLSRAPLLERKQLLEKIIGKQRQRLAFSSHWVGEGDRVFAMATEQKLEGILCKRVDSPYRAGRGDDWTKVKRLMSDEFAVVGYTPAKGQRKGFGALLLARPDGAGHWRYAGRVGTGFNDKMLRDVGRELATGGKKEPVEPVADIDPLLRNARWIKPRAVAEVYYRGIGNHGLLRQPSLKTLREDKSPKNLADSDRSRTRSAPARKSGGGRAQPKSKSGRARAKRGDGEIHITHPDRVVYPDDGITKQDVADYYAAVMEHFLPGVIDRPLSLLRCPSGIGDACFFQKHEMAGLHHVGTVKLKEESGTQAVYLYPEDATSVLELVQFGVLEFHPWGATTNDPDRADYIVFDLDPGDDVEWARVIDAARLVRKLLGEAGLESFVRTTGGKGLHVVLPLSPACGWDLVKDFTQGFAKALAEMHPQEFVAVSTKRIRRGRIFVDYLRNSRGATGIANWSLRARKGAPVAVPLRWSELGKLESGAAWDIHSARQRLARLRKDPWAGFDKVKQDLKAILQASG
ncbi:MAG: DNA ligase D [Rhodanobacteraceae bacterium]